MSQATYVCRQCWERDPTNYRLFTNKCEAPSRHSQSPRVQVYWQDGLLYQIRPVPDKEIAGRFILCFLGPQCKGDRCTYAHSKAEQDAWNREKFGPGSKRKLRTQYSYPTSGAPQYNPQRRHTSSESRSPPVQQQAEAQPQHHAKKPASGGAKPESHPGAQALRIDIKSPGRTQEPGYSHPQPHSYPIQLQPAKLVPNVDGAHLLVPGNYQYVFRELITLEQKSHAKILEERCNGQFELVVEKNYSGYSQVMGYLLGISGDNIAYVTQACDNREGVSISHESHEIRAAISSENYRHTEDVLYLDIDGRAFSQCFPAAKKRNKWKVSVKFLLKESYFKSLQRFIKSLSPEVVQRLIPNRQSFTTFQHSHLGAYDERLNLNLCSEDQCNALATIISSPPTGPPVLVTGAFGTGKTRILALAAHYYLKHSVATKQQVCILVCTQQHTSAQAFIECLMSLLIPIPEKAYVARVTGREMGHAPPKYSRSLEDFTEDHKRRPPSSSRPYLVVTTCQTAHSLKKTLPHVFFTHILLDEGAQMREPEAIAPLCFADRNTKIVIAGDKQQVGPDLLVLGEQPRGKGFAVSLLERLEKHYQQVGGAALHYLVRLVTNYRCHGDILSLAEELFYKSALKSEVSTESTHPDAPFPLIFVCSSISPPQSGENPVNELEARVVIEQLSKFAPGWPQDRWGAKLDPSQICIMSPSRSQLIKVRELLNSKGMEVAEILKQVQRHPTYDMQGREFRALFLSTFEATHEDGSTRNPTKSIADPYIFNTVVTRARSLVVSVGNPYLLLKMEEHMGRKYGEKGKCWSNYLKRCLDNNTLTFHNSIRILDAEKQERISQLRKAVEEHIATKYGLDESTGTFGSDSTPLQKRNGGDMEFEEEYDIPEKYTGRLEQDFHVKGLLGKGGFAHVYEVRSKTDGGSYALKIVKLPSKTTSHKKILREVRGLRKLDQPTSHPNIVRYYGSWIDIAPTDGRSKDLPWRDIESGAAMPYDETEDSGTDVLGRGDTSIETLTSPNHSDDSVVFKSSSHGTAGRNVDMTFSSTTTSTSTTVAGIHTTGAPVQGTPCLLIRTELCGKTLKEWLETHDWRKRKRSRLFGYFEQILTAVSYIHKKKLAHRDLKPSNIFFSCEDKTVVKVGDFGLVAGNFASGSPDLSTWSSRRSQYQVSFSGHAGTPLYMSPEQIEHSRCTEKVDIYSLGVIYFEMNYVFTTGHEKDKVVRELQRTQCKIPPRFSTTLPKETVVIQKMMTHDPDHRPSAEHILESRFFEELRNAVSEEPSHVPKM